MLRVGRNPKTGEEVPITRGDYCSLTSFIMNGLQQAADLRQPVTLCCIPHLAVAVQLILTHHTRYPEAVFSNQAGERARGGQYARRRWLLLIGGIKKLLHHDGLT